MSVANRIPPVCPGLRSRVGGRRCGRCNSGRLRAVPV